MKPKASKTYSPPCTRLQTLPLALIFVFGSMSAIAGVVIDQQPLNTQKPIPPNILFIMDDSGSMAWQHMPGTNANWDNPSSPHTGLPYRGSVANDIRLRAANINTQWYNPRLNYIPWVNHDGSSWGDINPRAAPFDAAGIVNTGTRDLGQTSWPTTTLTTTGTGTTGDTWRFQGFYVLNTGATATNNANYKRYEFRRNGAAWEGREVTLNSSGAVVTTTNRTSFTWPGGVTRTVAEEVQNYANWFSYYRLRNTMAKAAASRVFSQLDENNRVGYNTIWGDRLPYRIPVGTDNGLFRGENKKKWFENLFKTKATDGTPLRRSLDQAGQYFSEKGSTGPYGPESGSAQLSCRQNFTIMTTDGYWNSHEATTAAANSNVDGTDGDTITGIGGISYKYVASTPFRDTHSKTLADVAMYYWKNDLRPDLKNDVPTTATNPAFWQHMRTFGVSIGLRGTLDPAADLPALVAGSKSWPTPGNDKQENIDDLWHAAVNSRGDFLVATDPDEFSAALTDSLAKISSEARSAASGATSSSKLEEGTMAFFTEYAPGAWSGEIKASEINPTDGKFKPGSGWSASSKLPAPAARKIFFNDGSTQKAFLFENLSTTQKSALVSADHVDYLRGDRSKEKTLTNPSGIFRERASALPDFVNSQLVHVGAPNARLYLGASFTGAASYKSFAAGSRRAQIYVGGNGGMLHAFDAKTGAETYAFVPSSVINEDLRSLTDPDYVHRYFVDGELTVADVYDGGWKTILVGSLGRGGRALFALDVTNPDGVKFLWEKTSSEVPSLGNNLGKPIIAQVADNKWRVLVGNGPNGSGDEAQLIMLDVMSGAITTVSTGATGNNGLSAVRGWDSNADGFADTAYAGDLNGNVWRFSDLAGSPSATRLFAAKDGGGNAQPIMASPVPAINMSTGEQWVFVGTGRYLNEADTKNTSVQTWYGLIDAGESIGSRSSLVQRRILSSGDIDEREVKTIETGSAADLVDKNGWYIDFVSSGVGEGERMISPNFFYGTVLFGLTLTPEVTDACNPTGRGMLWGINPFTGARASRPIFDVDGDGMFDETLGGDPVSGIAINPLLSNTGVAIVGGDGFAGIITGGDGAGVDLITDDRVGAERKSWREILGN